MHKSRLHCCCPVGLEASKQLASPTPSRMHRTILVCTPVPHVTEHFDQSEVNHSGVQADGLHTCSLGGLDSLQPLDGDTMNPLLVLATQRTSRYWTPTPQDTEQSVHGPANHLAPSQFVPFAKHCLSVSGLSAGLQKSSLPSAHATCRVSTPLPHSAEHLDVHSE